MGARILTKTACRAECQVIRAMIAVVLTPCAVADLAQTTQ
jgi:hypothetical protein